MKKLENQQKKTQYKALQSKKNNLLIFSMALLLSIFIIGFISASETIEQDFSRSDNIFIKIIDFIFGKPTDNSLKIDGLSVSDIKVNTEEIKSLDHHSTNFNVRNVFLNKGDSIKQEIYIKNNEAKDGLYNFSTITEIGYDKVRWAGEEYYLTETPIRFESIVDDLTNRTIYPNIFFDDIFNKRINYADIGSKGGYALAYEKLGKYYIELRIDNLEVKGNEEFYLDPTYSNSTQGFSIAGAGINTPGSMVANNTDIYELRYNGTLYHWKWDGTFVESCYHQLGTGGSWYGLSSNSTYNSSISQLFAQNNNGTLIKMDTACTNIAVVISNVHSTLGVNFDVAGVAVNFSSASDKTPTGFLFSAMGIGFIAHTNFAGVNKTGFTVQNIITPPFNAFDIDRDENNLSKINFIDFTNPYLHTTDYYGTNYSTFGFSTLGVGASIPRGSAMNLSNYLISDSTDLFIYNIYCSDCIMIPADIPPNMTLSAPANNTNWSTNTIFFNGTARDDWIIKNISLLINGAINYTYAYNINGTANLSLNVFLQEGQYYWNMRTCDNSTTTQCAVSKIRNFSVDLGNPLVNLSQSNRTVPYHVLGTNLTLNWSIIDANLANCSVFFNGNLYRPECTDNNISLNISSYEYKSLNFTATDVFNNKNQTNISWDYRIFQNSISYTNSTTEGSKELIIFNITKLNGYTISLVSLNYNGEDNSIAFTSATTQLLQKNISVPNSVINTNFTFYLNISLSGGYSSKSPDYLQQVKVLSLDDCSVFTNQLFNITIFDEEGLYILQNTSNRTNLRVNLNIATLNNTQVLNYSNFSTYNPTRVCFQNPLSSTSNYRIDGVLEYSSLNRFHEFYNLQNYLLTNNTNNVSILLYNLNNTKGNEFKITYKDANFVPVQGALMNIQRKYIDEGIFRTTEIPKTGAEGYTIGHLVPNDVIYNIIILKDGVVLATFEEIVANCQNPLLSECSINLNSLSTSSLPSSFANYNDFSFNLDYDESTRVVSSINSIPSGVSGTILLNVTLNDALGNRTICTDSYVGAGGMLSCTIPNSFGNTSVWAVLYKDGHKVAQSIISLAEKPSERYGSNLLFLALFTIFIVIGIAINDNPMMFGIIFLLGVITMFSLNLIYTPTIIGTGSLILYLVIGIIVILIKGSNRQ